MRARVSKLVSTRDFVDRSEVAKTYDDYMNFLIRACMALMILPLASVLVLGYSVPARGQKSGYTVDPAPASTFLITSPKVRTDSRNEVVYEEQTSTKEDSKGLTPVNGAYVRPVPAKIPIAKYPRSLKATLSDASVTFFAIIAHDGSLIDIELPDGLDPDEAKAVMSTAPKYRFRPATLDGSQSPYVSER